jgi:putative transposase
VRYACITRHRDEYPLRLMCRELEVSPSGYHAWRKRSPSAHAIADERLMLNVRAVFEQSNGTYGSPRVTEELRDTGTPVGKKRVARIMRQNDLVARRKKKRRVGTTDSRHAHPIAPNELDRQFGLHDANGVRALNRVWLSDISVPQQAA